MGKPNERKSKTKEAKARFVKFMNFFFFFCLSLFKEILKVTVEVLALFFRICFPSPSLPLLDPPLASLEKWLDLKKRKIIPYCKVYWLNKYVTESLSCSSLTVTTAWHFEMIITASCKLWMSEVKVGFLFFFFNSPLIFSNLPFSTGRNLFKTLFPRWQFHDA